MYKATECLTLTTLQNIDQALSRAIYSYFDSWEDAIKQAGLWKEYIRLRAERSSSYQARTRRVLDSLNLIYEEESRPSFISGRKSLDFYIPSLNLAIEVDGGQHRRIGSFGNNLQCTKRRDLEKDIECYLAGISVIRINTDILNIYEITSFIEDYLDDFIDGKIKEVGVIEL